MDADGVYEGPPSPGGRPGSEENGVDNHAAGGYLLDGLDGDGELAAASVLRPEILDSVVKVYATHCEPNFSLPWQRRRQVQSTSSGFIISTPKGRRLLTNAHSVEHYTVVQVKKRGSDVKYQCTVLAIAHECDLALMTVEDEAFWADTQPLLPGGLPMLQDAIVVIGYPIGGDTVSVTAGVVSRVEMMPYSHGQAELLGVQVDSAINPGNSGGPAFNDQRQVVGVAFQGLAPTEAEAIGYIIPWVVVSHFLDDVERHGRYTGFCYAGFEWSKLENKDMRLSLSLTTPDLGVLVKHVEKPTPAAEKLSKGDVVTHIDGVPISSGGTVPYRAGARITFTYLCTRKFVGDTVTLTIVRAGKVTDITYPLGNVTDPLLVPVHETRRTPEYLVLGGLVFVALSEKYLSSEYGSQWDAKAPVRLLVRLMHTHKKEASEQVVLLSQVLNATLNRGFEHLSNCQLFAVNGTPVRNVSHLASLVDAATTDYLSFELDYDECVVVHREKALAATQDILDTHSIAAARSIGPLPGTKGGAAGGDKAAAPVVDAAAKGTPVADAATDGAPAAAKAAEAPAEPPPAATTSE